MLKKKITIEISGTSADIIDNYISDIIADKADGIETVNVTDESTELVDVETDEKSIFDLIRDWATAKGIYDKGDPKTQYLKLQEECGELAKAILSNNVVETVDALGDCVVVLVNLAHLCGYNLESCIQFAYNVISKRTGKMVNGTFVKDK